MQVMTKCPICKNNQTILFCDKKHYFYYLCQNCHTLFLKNQPSKQKIEQYYRHQFGYKNGLSEQNNIRNQSKKILLNLLKFNSKGERLLDIGSGYGVLLEEANRYPLKAIGIEPSTKLYNQLKKFDYLNNRILITSQTFDDFYKKNKDAKFDFITAVHVIEHLKNPQKFIRQAVLLLNRNGILYIETPNLNSHLFYSEKQNYTFLTPPEHLWVFSKKSFNYLLPDLNQYQVKTFTYSYRQHLMGVIKNNLQLIFNQRLKIENKGLKSYKFKTASQQSRYVTASKYLKYLFFDRLLAKIAVPLLNIGGKGSILELYIKKIY